MANDGGRRAVAAVFTIQPTGTTTDSEQGLSQANRVTEQSHEKEKCSLKKADGTLFACYLSVDSGSGISDP
jgi:hypothetical protein